MPSVLSVDVAKIPAELKSLQQWGVWRFERSAGGKFTKIPHNHSGGVFDSTNPSTWCTFAQALAAYQSGNFDGMAFALNGLCGIDFDKCRNPETGDIDPWAQAWIDRIGGYCEISPSETGVKIIVRAKKPGDRCKHTGRRVEIYTHGRFFAITGHGDGAIIDQQPQVDALYAELFSDAAPRDVAPISDAPPNNLDDDTILKIAAKAKNADKFAALWGGSVADHNGDHSAADMALCSMLAFYAGPGGQSQVDRLFRRSGLMREKWDRKTGQRGTYGAITIARVYETATNFYAADTDDFGNWHGAAPGTAQETRATHTNDGERLPQIRNAVWAEIEIGGEATRVPFALAIDTIGAEIQSITDGWPRRVAGHLFVANPLPAGIPEASQVVRTLDNAAAMFGWLKESPRSVIWTTQRGAADAKKAPRAHGEIKRGQFARSATLVKEQELYEWFCDRAAPNYSSVEVLPHHPSVDGIYYAPVDLPTGTGDCLVEFLDRLNGETELDRWLMCAAILTPGWGGPCGARPAFIFASDHGPGTGKTQTAEKICGMIWGGRVTWDAEDEDFISFRSRLLDTSSIGVRCVLVDNVKSRLTGGGIDQLITSAVIDGKKMYVGQTSRPNRLTVFITSNTPQVSRDLAERSVIVKFGPQQHSVAWTEWAERFISDHRAELLADAFYFLRRDDRCEISTEHRDRWRAWHLGVLQKLEMGNECAGLIIARRPEVDVDASDAEGIIECVREELRRRGHDPETETVAIPVGDMHQILVDAGEIDRSISVRGVATIILRIGPGSLIVRNPSRVGGRSWLWLPADTSIMRGQPTQIMPRKC